MVRTSNRSTHVAPPHTRWGFGCSGHCHVSSGIALARGVIGNTPGFGPDIPSSSLGGPAFFALLDEPLKLLT